MRFSWFSVVFRVAWELVWPGEWSNTLLDVQGFRPHYDFIRAINPISSSFAGALEVDLICKERKNKKALSIIDLIKEFKEHYRIQQVSSATTANSSAFATLGNSNTNLDSNGNPNSSPNSNSNSNSRWPKKCICGLMHRLGDYYYIVKRKRP